MGKYYTEVCRDIVRHFGKQHQIQKAIEELNELSVALAKYSNLPCGDYIRSVTEEMADVEIMLEQLKVIFNNKNMVMRVRDYKLKRTLKRYDIKAVRRDG